MEYINPIIDAEFEEIQESLRDSASRQLVSAQSTEVGPVKSRTLCAS
ncbi:MAG: hypothetical protein AAFW83_09035 [Pseudomonadota bacterium]